MRFELGRLLATQGVVGTLTHDEIMLALSLHGRGEWGADLCDEDKQANEDAIRDGARIVSAYHLRHDRLKVYVITEADRSATTILFPEEY